MNTKSDPLLPPTAPTQSDSPLSGVNAGYLEALYQTYRHNPQSIDADWQAFFEQLPRTGEPSEPGLRPVQRSTGSDRDADRQIGVLQLIHAYRFLGHRRANLDPLHLYPLEEIQELRLQFYRLGKDDLDRVFHTGSIPGLASASLRKIISVLEETYCGPIGSEYMHISSMEKKRWLQEHLENTHAHFTFTHDHQLFLLQRLTAAEALERHLHTKYVGQKRFSLEGAESLIPLLDTLIEQAAKEGVREAVIGMAHRGRLNVLINILGKSSQELFQEFEGRHESSDIPMGDVKYHLGFSSDRLTSAGPIHLALAFNPSHLEIINPVVEGSVRARQDRRGDRQGRKVIPIAIHGDAAFAGQGVVMETLNMSQTRGFSTKGTIHIIVNNQIGFTVSTPMDARSSLYCTDVAKMIGAPILHVNGDHPEAVVLVTRLALDYRMRYGEDVVIDLVCYRRHGHNEADEPSVTQPTMYRRIRELPTTRARYARVLQEGGVIEVGLADKLLNSCRAQLKTGAPVVPIWSDKPPAEIPKANWAPYRRVKADREPITGVPLPRLRMLAEHLIQLPADFTVHPRVAKILEDRRRMAAGEIPIDWGFAEMLAYASLVTEKHAVRLCGQDSGRGTFFHRHAVLHNQSRRESYIPLRHLDPDQADFLIIDSLLSEEAVLAFEYGYATASPGSLVIWEAQFGDFANGAQVVIDQFISSGEEKWGRLNHLVLFLPHGYEGQGSEHSSARLERFLQLCANNNMQVCYPTLPAQMFHLLRRQILRPVRKPLVVMSPKSLLRHKLSISQLNELESGVFQVVLPDPDSLNPQTVKQVVICSGHIFFDLLDRRRTDGRHEIALIRIEQLYPFPRTALGKSLATYPQAQHIVWCQEEPRNQGAWRSIRKELHAVITPGKTLQCLSRNQAAAPAVGYYALHLRQLHNLLDAVFS